MDLLSLISGEVSLLAKYTSNRNGLEGIVYQLLCNLIHNGLGLFIHSCASSYNLAVLSAVRMFNIVWPIRHRNSFTPKNIKWAAVLVWLFSILAVLSHSMHGTNDIAHNGHCYFWRVCSAMHAPIFTITFNMTLLIIPSTIMIVCFTVIYAKIIGSRLKVKMNIIRVILTCILLYFVYHAPHFTMGIIYKYGNSDWMMNTYGRLPSPSSFPIHS